MAVTDELDPFVAQNRVLGPLMTARKLLALIEGAAERGVLRALADGVHREELASLVANGDGATAQALIDALCAGGVVKAIDDRYLLTEEWAAAQSEFAGIPMSTRMAGNEISAALLRDLGGDTYWTMPSDQRVTLASSVSPDPFVGRFGHMLEQMAEAGHPHASVQRAGGRMLELGCGVAGAALSALTVFADLTVVGVELSDDLADEAERRAEALGVADRFTVVRGDAGTFEDDEAFDSAFWSQFFFSDEARPGALATLRRSVRPGAPIAVPVRWLNTELADPSSPPGQEHALFRAMAQSWGVPDRDPDQLVDELSDAGFVDPHVFSQTPTNALVVVHQPA